MIFETLAVGPLQCNCSILACETTREALIVDPGGEAERILAALQRHRLKPKYIVHTHAHFDHLGATHAVARSGADTCLHRDDLFLYENIAMQAALFNMPTPPDFAMTQWIKDQDVLRFGNHAAEVLHTPGHSPGSVTFRVSSGDKYLLFTGDTLFQGSIGRTDLWGGNFQQIIKSIRDKILCFAEDTEVYPGHGEATTLALEKEYNPFLQDER